MEESLKYYLINFIKYLDSVKTFYENSISEDSEEKKLRISIAIELCQEACKIYKISYPDDKSINKLMDILIDFTQGKCHFANINSMRMAIGNGSRKTAYDSYHSAFHLGHKNYYFLQSAYKSISIIINLVDCITFDLSGKATGSSLNATPKYLPSVESFYDLAKIEIIRRVFIQ